MAGFPIAVDNSKTGVPPATPIGAVVAKNQTVRANGLAIAVATDPLYPHGNPQVQPLCQSSPTVIKGYDTIRINNQPVAYVGSICSCTHIIATGIPTITVGPA